MFKLIPLLILYALHTQQAAAQSIDTVETIFTELDIRQFAERMFDGGKIDSLKEIIWEPNYSERINMPISYDKFCHTTMDTIIYYSNYTSNYAVVIFSTYAYTDSKSRQDCHACGSMLSLSLFRLNKSDHSIFQQNESSKWELLYYNKSFLNVGAWGERRTKISVERLGKTVPSIRFEHKIDGNQGENDGFIEYYALDSYRANLIFDYCYYYSSEGAYEDERGFTETKTMKTIEEPDNKYYTIELTSNHNKKSKKKKIKKTYYFYSEGTNRFEMKESL